MKVIFGTTLLTILVGCVAPTGELSVESTKKAQEVHEEDNYFAGRKGCFLLYNMKTKVFDKVINEGNCREQLVACSTFKVPLAVMAFDSGILMNENQVLKWNGVKSFLRAHNQDHNAKTWMRDSVVWFSQRISTKLGAQVFQKYLNDFNYGNKDISASITEAWLVSPAKTTSALKISAYEQVEFMTNLWTDRLPTSKRSMQIARDITFLEDSPNGFKLSGKTGSNLYDKEKKTHLGWFISHLKKDEQEYIAVTNFSDLSPSEEPGYGGPKAKMLTKKILTKLGLW